LNFSAVFSVLKTLIRETHLEVLRGSSMGIAFLNKFCTGFKTGRQEATAKRLLPMYPIIQHRSLEDRYLNIDDIDRCDGHKSHAVAVQSITACGTEIINREKSSITFSVLFLSQAVTKYLSLTYVRS
jgi:hypothetical protein